MSEIDRLYQYKTLLSSPFKNTGSMATISCYKCGQHKPRSMGIFKKLINQQMFMCGDCMPASLLKAVPFCSWHRCGTQKSPTKRFLLGSLG